jgi:hypothetical protein
MEHRINFPRRFDHDHPPVRNTNELFEAKRTASIRASDRFAAMVGSPYRRKKSIEKSID